MNFGSVEAHVEDHNLLIRGNEDSKEQNSIPEIMSQYGGGLIKGVWSRKSVLTKLLSCVYQAKKSVGSIRNNPQPAKKHLSKADLEKLEDYIKSLGISAIGYTKVDRKHIFKDSAILFEYAIVMVLEMEREAIEAAPSKSTVKEIFRTYNELGLDVNKVSSFLRSMGYQAMAGPAIGGAANYVPLAQDAGLGCIGKHGLLITEHDFGPSLRLAVVYTDIENLPLSKENNYLWIRDFCDRCNQCVKNCPAGAIYNYSNEDKRETSIDYKKCATPFAKDYGCTLCVKHCSFFKGDYQKLKTAHFKRISKELGNE